MWFLVKTKILEICRINGFFIEKDALDLALKLEVGEFKELVDKIREKGNEKVITKGVLADFIGTTREVDIIYAPKFLQRKIVMKDFVSYFRSRHNKIKKILEEKGFENLTSVRKLSNSSHMVIVSIFKKWASRSGNIFLEIEDLSGSATVLVMKSRNLIFNKALNLLEDDIVALNVSHVNERIFVNDLFYPDSLLKERRYSVAENLAVFCGDLHVGSKFFLEKNFLDFMKWVNGEFGTEEERELSKKVKYLFFLGDNIDGVSHFPGQEKFLDEKTPREQYKKFAELVRLIRKDVSIVICPGQHDSVWVGEPQPAIKRKWAEELYNMKNVYIVPNPSIVKVDGFKVLMYHGASINRFIDEVSEIRTKYGHKFPTKVVAEILKRRHLAPMHGLMDYIPTEDDSLVIEMVPDIFAVGDQHRADVSIYNNILIIASSCFQSQTPFEEKMGNISEPCRVPIFNLKSREIKILNFSGSGDENSN